MNLRLKNLFGCLAMLIALIAAPMAKAEKSVVVVSKDGTQTGLALDKVHKIEIKTDGIVLHGTDATTTTVAHADLDRVLIGSEWSSIKGTLAEGNVAVWPTLATDVVNAGGFAEGTAVTVFDLNGAALASARTNADGLATVSIAHLTPGMYIVKAGDKSVKIVKK